MGLDAASLRIETPRAVLRLPGAEEAARVLAYLVENRAFHAPWEPPRPEEHYTLASIAARLERNRAEAAEDRSLKLYLHDRDDPARVLGVCAFTSIVRGPLQSCSVGYGLAASAEGRGLAAEALAAALDFVWDTLRLHRVEASYQPSNERSARLLKRLGFSVEGYARDYLFIGGAWQDHLLAAIRSPRFPASFTLP